MNRSLDEALELSPSKSTVPRSRFEVVVSREATSAFVFESKRLLRNGVELRRIETTGETMATIGKMAIALRLHEVPRFTDAWMPRYLLYIRKTPEGDPIIDPLRASGLVYYDPELRVTADFIAPFRAGLEDTYSALSFLVAHELYHLDHPFHCKDVSEICMGRRRQHEADADAFAIYVLSNHAKNKGVPDHYLAVPLVIFSQLMLTMEGRRKPIFPQTHPPDHERLRSAAMAVDKWLNENPGKSDGSLRLMVDQTLKVLHDIETETPAAYFAGMDQEASKVTLDSLKVY
jgi:hypothetical protein